MCLCFKVVKLVFLVSGVGSYIGDDGVELVDAKHFKDEWSSVAWVHGGEGIEFFLFGEYRCVE